jgi:hypothetical protein
MYPRVIGDVDFEPEPFQPSPLAFEILAVDGERNVIQGRGVRTHGCTAGKEAEHLGVPSVTRRETVQDRTLRSTERLQTEHLFVETAHASQIVDA